MNLQEIRAIFEQRADENYWVRRLALQHQLYFRVRPTLICLKKLSKTTLVKKSAARPRLMVKTKNKIARFL